MDLHLSNRNYVIGRTLFFPFPFLVSVGIGVSVLGLGVWGFSLLLLSSAPCVAIDAGGGTQIGLHAGQAVGCAVRRCWDFTT